MCASTEGKAREHPRAVAYAKELQAVIKEVRSKGEGVVEEFLSSTTAALDGSSMQKNFSTQSPAGGRKRKTRICKGGGAQESEGGDVFKMREKELQERQTFRKIKRI